VRWLALLALLVGCKQKETALQEVAVPGLTISMPAGRVTRHVEFEGGRVHVAGRREFADLLWGTGEAEPDAQLLEASLTAGNFGQARVGKLEPWTLCDRPSHTGTFTLGDISGRVTTWFVDDEKRWFVLITMGYPSALHGRLVASARCQAVTARPPPLFPLFSEPAGYTRLERDYGIIYSLADDSIVLMPGTVASAPNDSVETAEGRQRLARELGRQLGDEFALGRPDARVDGDGIERTVVSFATTASVTPRDGLAMMWYCPASARMFLVTRMWARGRDAGLAEMGDLLMGARCPPAQSAP